MKSIRNLLIPIVAAFTLATTTPQIVKAQDNESAGNSSFIQGLKASVYYNTFSDNSLKREYGPMALFQLGTEGRLSEGFYLGATTIFGFKKEINEQNPYQISYWSNNLELTIGAKRDKDASLYGTVGIGLVSFSERDNEGNLETKDSALGGYIGTGLQLRLGEGAYIFGEMKENIGRVLYYGDLISLNSFALGVGFKVNF